MEETRQDAPAHDVDPRLAEKRDIRGDGQTSQITAEMDEGTVEHVYQTADGREVVERIDAADASMVPSEANTPIVSNEHEALFDERNPPSDASRGV